MKPLAILFAAIGSLSLAFGNDVAEGQLPSHSPWIEIESADFDFRIAKIDLNLKVSEIENPPPKDFSKLVSCATWFVHHMHHTADLEGLRSLLEWWDEFQSIDPFERISQKDRSAAERSYTHLVDYEGFYFLIGTMRNEDNSSVRVIGTYHWDNERNRFFSILDTPGFYVISGRKFRSALYEMDLDSLSP